MMSQDEAKAENFGEILYSFVIQYVIQYTM